jgi:hypothetical protein
METNTTAPSLRLVVDGAAREPTSEPPREEYWAQVQALRAELAGLRPAN